MEVCPFLAMLLETFVTVSGTFSAISLGTSNDDLGATATFGSELIASSRFCKSSE
jgi:hypothetical protein